MGAHPCGNYIIWEGEKKLSEQPARPRHFHQYFSGNWKHKVLPRSLTEVCRISLQTLVCTSWTPRPWVWMDFALFWSASSSPPVSTGGNQVGALQKDSRAIVQSKKVILRRDIWEQDVPEWETQSCQRASGLQNHHRVPCAATWSPEEIKHHVNHSDYGVAVQIAYEYY